MMHLNKLLFALFLLLCFQPATSQNKERSRKAQDIQDTSFFIVENESNDYNVAELGQNVQNAILDNNEEAFMSLFDTEGFGDLVVAGTENNDELKSYRDGFLKGIAGSISVFPKKLIAEIKNGSYYDFVNYSYSNDMNTYYMLFRIYSAETGINYHHYRVSKRNGKFVFNDIYVYLSGEELSKTIQRFYMYTLPKKNLLSFFGEDNSKELVKLAEGVNSYNAGDFNTAYTKMNALEGDFKNDKFVLVITAICASNINDDLYSKSIKKIMDTYPDDATLYLSQIDYYLIKQEYDKALVLFERLKQETDDDFLELLMGNIEFERMNFEKALAYFKTITEGYPDFFEGHSSVLSCLSLLKKYDECVEVLNFLVNDGYDKNDIIGFVEELDANNENILKDLAISEAFITWKNI